MDMATDLVRRPSPQLPQGYSPRAASPVVSTDLVRQNRSWETNLSQVAVGTNCVLSMGGSALTLPLHTPGRRNQPTAAVTMGAI